MPELRRAGSTPRHWEYAVRVARLAERQSGVVSFGQLVKLGLSRSTIARWTAQGRLHRIYPGVYAVGHRALDVRGRLRAALLYAGSGAALSHQTAAWWWNLIDSEPQTIHLSVSRRPASLSDIRIHRPRRLEVTHTGDFPVTTVPRTLLDIASVLAFAHLRRALAEADYRGLLDIGEIDAVLGHGRPGSTRLRSALAAHRPELARTLSDLEERFLALCERHSLPIPEVNARVEGLMVDCLWRPGRVIVELDGRRAHGTPAAVESDRRRDLILRRAGFAVRRYTWQQVTRSPELVVADVRTALAANRN